MEPMLCAVTSANLRGDAGSRIAKISQKVNFRKLHFFEILYLCARALKLETLNSISK